MKLKLISIIIVTFFCLTLSANDKEKKKIYVDLSQVKDLDQAALSFIRKSGFDTIFMTEKFDLLLSPPDLKTKTPLYIVKGKIEKDGLNYRVSFSLLERKRIINSVQDLAVEENRVQLRSRILLLKLFYGNNVDERTGTLRQRKLIPLDVPSIDSSFSKKKVEGSKELESPDASADELHSEENPKDISNLSNKDDVPKRKRKKPFVQPFDAPDLVLTKLPKEDPSLKRRKLKWFVNSQFSLGHEVESIDSLSIIELKTNSQKVVFDYETQIQLENWNNTVELGGSVAKPIGQSSFRDTTLSFGPRLSLFSNYRIQILKDRFSAAIQGEFESVDYGALGIVGEGIQTYSNRSVFFGVDAKLSHTLFDKKVSAQVSFKKAFLGNTNLDTLGSGFAIDGLKQSAAIEAQVYKDWYITLKHHKSTYTSLSVKDYRTSHNLNSVHITYK